VGHTGNQITVISSGVAKVMESGDLTIPCPAVANQMYDVYVYDNGGTLAAELVAWTNDASRAVALLRQANGLICKNGDATRRWIGSFRTTSAGNTEDSVTRRYISNFYNKVTKHMRVTEPTDSWAYTAIAYRQANANPANQLDFVVADYGSAHVRAHVIGLVSNSTGNLQQYVSIGYDSATTAFPGVVGQSMVSFTASAAQPVIAHLSMYAATGRHVLTWLEAAWPAGATTWYGDNANAALYQSGIFGEIEC
jgi:hypothetical protein